MRKSKSELWVRHVRSPKCWHWCQKSGLFYHKLIVKFAREKAYMSMMTLKHELEEMNSLSRRFNVGKVNETEVTELGKIIVKWHFSVWGELFTVSTPNLSNRRILRYVKPTR